MSKSLIDAFEQRFQEALSASRSKERAFNQVSESFERQIGASPYSNYDSFRTSRARRKKKTGN